VDFESGALMVDGTSWLSLRPWRVSYKFADIMIYRKLVLEQEVELLVEKLRTIGIESVQISECVFISGPDRIERVAVLKRLMTLNTAMF